MARNVRIALPTDAASYPSRKECSKFFSHTMLGSFSVVMEKPYLGEEGGGHYANELFFHKKVDANDYLK